MKCDLGVILHRLVVAVMLLTAWPCFAAPAEDKAPEPFTNITGHSSSDSSTKPTVDKARKPRKNKVGESRRDYKRSEHFIPPMEILEEREPPPTNEATGARGAINPTAPNAQTQNLSGDFTDSDGDGMTDAAEVKFGFDPHDSTSFPTEPEVIVPPPPPPPPTPIPIPESGIGASYDNGNSLVTNPAITIRFPRPTAGNYGLRVKSGDRQLLYRIVVDQEVVNLAAYGLNGTETLTCNFELWDVTGHWQASYPTFLIDLNSVAFLPAPLPSIVGDPANRLSYTFKDFPADKEQQYRDFLKKLFPIMYNYLGTPAEKFNVVITNMGFDSGYFMSSDDGRTFLSDTDFIPRLIAHELVHAWKGKYLMASDANWNYDDLLSGFEESMAEGMAFEMMHEFVRSYPTDPATIQLLNWKPFQYYSSETTYYDSVRLKRDTTAGDFWNPQSMVYDKYSTAATTFEIMQKTNPLACREILRNYYAKINSNPAWRPNRSDLIQLWAEVVPRVNGAPLGQYLEAMPVFAGQNYDEGVLVQSAIRPYGSFGDHQYAVTYANKDGQAWWGIKRILLPAYNLPSWISWVDSTPPDAYVYVNTQDQPFTVNLYNGHNEQLQTLSQRTNILAPPLLGNGWKMVDELNMLNFPVGLYRETLTFTDFLPYDAGAREDRYFFGTSGLDQDKATESMIMVGIDGVTSGTVTAVINGTTYSQPLTSGAAVFKSTEWPFDLEGNIPLTIMRADGVAHTYYRTLLEASTYWNFRQTQFIIQDKDFDGVEDDVQAVATGISSTAQTFASAGGSGNVMVRTGPGESWTATASEPWVTITSGATGSRPGLLYYSVEPYMATASRVATLNINGKTVRILQLGENDSAAPVITLDTVVSPSRNSTQTISGTVTPYAAVAVSTGTGMVGADVTGSNWSCTLTGLAEGDHTLTVTATGLNGKTASSSAMLMIDTVLPTVLITSPVTGLTTNNTHQLAYTASDGTVVVTVDGIVVTKASGDTLAQFADGLHTVKVEAIDAAGNSGFAEVILYVDATAPTVTIMSPTVGDGNSRTPALLYTVSDGTTVVKVDGAVVSLLSGDTLGPLADGLHTMRVEASDAAGNAAFAEVSFTVDTAAPDVSITSPSVGLTKNNRPVLTYTASDGTVVVKVDGVVVNKASGDALDTLADGLHAVRVEATDAAGNMGFAEAVFMVDATAPVVSITSPISGTTPDNTPLLSYTVGEGNVVVIVDGVVVDKVPGNDLDLMTNATHTVRVEVTDVAGNVGIASVTFAVDHSPLAIGTAPLTWGTTGEAHNQAVTATGGVPPYNWSMVSGVLPTGLSLNTSNGTVSGTPSAVGSFSFTLEAADSDGATATKSLLIDIYAPLAISATSLPNGNVSASYNRSLSATGGLSPYSWTLATGAIPDGLSLNSSTGAISGTPTAIGTSSFTVQVRDANNAIASKALSITVDAALPDLVATATSGPKNGNQDKTINVTATVRNLGPGSAAASNLSFYLSTDATITTADIRLVDASVNTLPAGATQSISATVTIPSTMASGTYYFGTIVNPTGMVVESIETNNTDTGNTIEIK